MPGEPTPLFDWDDANRAHPARHAVAPDEAEQVVLRRAVNRGCMDVAAGKDPCSDRVPREAKVARVLAPHTRLGTMIKKTLAGTRTEADEARWFEENQERLLELFEQAEKAGALRIGGKSVGIAISKKTESLRKPPSQKVMLRIPNGDLDRARHQAGNKGIGYQTYIKMLLREGLDREEQSRRRA